jgi:Holliday junction resolvase
MNKSESIKELALALSKFQGEVTDVPKTKEVKINGKVMFKHAELSGVLDIARPLLTKHGLSVVQLPGSADSKITVETVLMHSSGDWISSTIEMTLDTNSHRMSSPQEVGKYITYARRYGLAAILGIAQVDEEEAMVQSKDKDEIIQQKPMITALQVQDLKSLIKGDLELTKSIREKYKIQNLEECTQGQYFAIKHEIRILKSSATIKADADFVNDKVA